MCPKIMKKITLVIAAIAVSVSAMFAQTRLSDETAYKVKAEGFSNSQIEQIAQFMTDELGPRLAASQMKVRSEQMVVEKLKEMGFQNARIEFAYDFPKGGWDNQMNYVAMTAPYYCSFAANPKAWSGSTDGLVKGECVVLEANTKEDLEKYKGKLAGKIVLMPATQTYEMSFEPLATRYTQEQLDEMEKDPRPRAVRRRISGGNWIAARELQQAVAQQSKTSINC